MSDGDTIHDTARRVEGRYNNFPQWRKDWAEQDAEYRRALDRWATKKVTALQSLIIGLAEEGDFTKEALEQASSIAQFIEVTAMKKAKAKTQPIRVTRSDYLRDPLRYSAQANSRQRVYVTSDTGEIVKVIGGHLDCSLKSYEDVIAFPGKEGGIQIVVRDFLNKRRLELSLGRSGELEQAVLSDENKTKFLKSRGG
jgi:hypothetical protein